MAGIGLYGVYYSKATVTDGVVTGYNGASMMGKAISASFTNNDAKSNRLWANNAVAETDATSVAGGELSLTLDKLTADAHADLYGLTKKTKSVTVGGESVSGTGFDYDGSEEAAAVGVAFIRWNQESQARDKYEAVIYAYATFAPMDDTANTYNGDNGIEWQTPELTATVSAGAITGAYPWRQKYVFPTQAAAIQFIDDAFASGAVTT